MTSPLAIAPEPGVAKPDPILVARGVRRTFGGLLAVDVDHVEVQRNTITALIGPNGAGKTKLFNLLTGFDRPDSGSWSYDGTQLAGKPAYGIARAGMVRTFQLTKALARLTVLDNMLLAAPSQRGEHLGAEAADLRQEHRVGHRAAVHVDEHGVGPRVLGRADDALGHLAGLAPRHHRRVALDVRHGHAAEALAVA